MNRIVTFGIVILAVGLLGLGVHALYFPVMASKGYGVPISKAAIPWVMAAGIRDAALGLLTIGLLWRRYLLPLFLGSLLIIPVTDSLLAIKFGDSAMAPAPHLFGVVGIVALLILVLLDNKNRKAKPPSE